MSPIGSSPSAHSSSTYTWQVAQLQLPPHSPTMPAMPLRTAADMTDSPTWASTMRSAPPSVMKTTLGMRTPIQFLVLPFYLNAARRMPQEPHRAGSLTAGHRDTVGQPGDHFVESADVA